MLTPLTLLVALMSAQPSAVDAVRCAIKAAQAAPAPIEQVDALADGIVRKCEPLVDQALAPAGHAPASSPEAAAREKATAASLRAAVVQRMRDVALQILKRRASDN